MTDDIYFLGKQLIEATKVFEDKVYQKSLVGGLYSIGEAITKVAESINKLSKIINEKGFK